MKANGTLKLSFLRCIIIILLFITSHKAFSQPDYDFRNPTLISGTDKQIGAVYLFQTVKPGVDAFVTIKDITGGIILSTIDGGSGYAEALQPVLDVPAFANGYVEFDIDFVFAGTSVPMLQVEVPATPIDIDGMNYGDGVVNEFDILQLTNGYVDYDMFGGELTMNISSPWVTGYNVGTIDYPGVDTTPRQVMFTTVNANISRFTFRTGASSTSASTRQRLRSVYFKKFVYQNSLLPENALVSFKGNIKEENVILYWNLAKTNNIQKVFVERSATQNKFERVGEISANIENPTYSFNDSKPISGVSFYRLKLVESNGKFTYSSVIPIKNSNTASAKSFNVYPTFINSQATLELKSDKTEQATLRFVDYNGRIVYQKNLQVNAGVNTIAVTGLEKLSEGNYVASVT
jgi:hypothetical protein